RFMRRFPSEGHETVGDLLAPPRLLGARYLAATAICDPRAGDAVVFDLVVPRDIRRAHDAGNLQVAQLEIDPNLLIALNGQMPVRQHPNNRRRHAQRQLLVAPYRSLSALIRFTLDPEDRPEPRGDLGRQDILEPEEGADADLLAAGTAAGRGVAHLCLVVDLDHHGQDVADTARALVPEQGRGRVVPQRPLLIAVARRLGRRYRQRHTLGGH